VSFPQGSSLLFPDPLLLFFLSLKSLSFLLIFLTALVLFNHGFSMSTWLCAHAEVQKVIQIVCMLCDRHHIKLNLPIELRNESRLNWKISGFSQQTFIYHYFQSITFEKWQKVFSSCPCHNLFLCINLLALSCPLLEIPSFTFINATLTSSFHSLSFHEFSLLNLKEEFFVFLKLLSFKSFDGLNLC
jgi:hypothetical protein